MEIIIEFSEPSLASYYDVNFDHVVQVQYTFPLSHSHSCPVPIPPSDIKNHHHCQKLLVSSHHHHQPVTTSAHPQLPLHFGPPLLDLR